MALLPPVPFARFLGSVIADRARVTDDWRWWFQGLKDGIDRAAQRVGSAVALTAQAATIAATALPTGTLAAGLYRVSWFLRITQAATTDSSVAVTIGATVDGVATSQAGEALTSNTVGAVQSGSVIVEADQASSITYAVAYSSTGATACQFALDVVVEGMPA